MKNKLKEIINGLKAENDYQDFVLGVAIPMNMKDKCYDEVLFYIHDAFDNVEWVRNEVPTDINNLT